MYSVALVTSTPAIVRLEEEASALLASKPTVAQPRLFIASLSRIWTPRVVVARNGGQIAGIVYAKERTICGVPVGVVYIDTTLGGLIVRDALEEDEVFLRALECLFSVSRIRAVRAIIPSSRQELANVSRIRQLLECDVCSIRFKNSHRTVPLSCSYEAFLESLGYQTRRTFRRYRKKAEAEKYSFAADLSIAEFESGALSIIADDVIRAKPELVKRAKEMIAAAAEPVLAGLRDSDGRWVSVLGGWRDGDRVTVVIQANSVKRYPQHNLSTVLRAYFCESMILKGVKELLFWGGVEGRLKPYSTEIPALCAYIDSRVWFWVLFRRGVGTLVGRFSGPIRRAAYWIVPVKTDDDDSVPLSDGQED